MSTIFNLILIKPLFNALVVLYEYVTFKDLGLAIIVLTLLIRLVLYPLFSKMARHQAAMRKIQPEMKRIQTLHKDDKEKQALEMMALWKKHDFNPFAGLLLNLIQLPIVFAIFRVFRTGITEAALTNLYSFVPVPNQIGHSFLGLIDLSQPSMIILILAVAAVYFQIRLTMPKPDKQDPRAAKTGSILTIVGPAILALVLFSVPAAVGLYILTYSVFSFFQQIAINKKYEHAGEPGTKS